MRAVGRDAEQVAQVRAFRNVEYLVDQFVRTTEIAGRSHVAVHDYAFEVLGRQLQRYAGRYLDVLETVIRERRHKGFGAFAFENIGVELADLRCVRRAQVHVDVPLIDPSGRIEQFAVPHRYDGSARPLHAQSAYSGEVFPQVVDVYRVVDLLDRYRFYRSGCGDGRHFLRFDQRRGRLDGHGGLPGAVVESGTVPSRLFEPGVVRYAGVQVVVQQRAGRRFPRSVAADRFGRSVPVGDMQFAQ